MIPTFMIFSAERTKTEAEQRAADVRTGQLSAAFGDLSASLSAPLRALRRLV
jgi:hypothetical protein